MATKAIPPWNKKENQFLRIYVQRYIIKFTQITKDMGIAAELIQITANEKVPFSIMG